jgi:hypothetical protein
MTNTPESDDALVERLRTTAMADRIAALLDAVNDTATWQPAPANDADGRAR